MGNRRPAGGASSFGVTDPNDIMFVTPVRSQRYTAHFKHAFNAAPDRSPDHARARPGCLAPHAWPGDGRSLYSFGQGSPCVADGADEAPVALAVQEARELGVPLEIVRPWEPPSPSCTRRISCSPFGPINMRRGLARRALVPSLRRAVG